ncbi:MAG: isoprenylcysteine carboxylmethyltransferase family protein [Alphaproteobacteria bacterium]|nr:isoprenylcysteine carboxylmethyltransferase family protein [Alphaproteobacteria bacterium]
MLLKLLAQLVPFLLFQGAVLFGAAGTLDWPQGWALMIEFSALCLAISLWLWRTDPGLLAERMGGIAQEKQPTSDRLLMIGIMVGWIGWCVAMGLEARWYGPRLPLLSEVLGGVLLALGYGTVAVVFRTNSFAAPVVKIQDERGQRVIDTGPYAWVRHPMYTGGLLIFLAFPLMLGSLWGLALVPLFVAALILRTMIEERTLRVALAGYNDYAARVRWRYLPYVF